MALTDLAEHLGRLLMADAARQNSFFELADKVLYVFQEVLLSRN
jgi:hypothetical protein